MDVCLDGTMSFFFFFSSIFFFFWPDLNQVWSANNQCIQDFLGGHFEPQLCSSKKGPAAVVPLSVAGNECGALLRAESHAPA